MSSLCRRSLLVFTFAALTFLASSAYAQYDCADVCDPYFSYCSDYCQRCLWYTVDGCGQYVDSTCESTGACLSDNCSPNWQETSRVNVGTYDGRSLNGCNHHRVDEVVMTDQNSCNINANYRSYEYCHNYIDDYKNGCCYPSCCEGYGENGTLLECNGVHGCG